MDSILKELIAEICVDSGLDESKFDKGPTLKRLIGCIGQTKLEANIITGYEKRLKEAQWQIMVSMTRLLRYSSDCGYSALSLSTSPSRSTRPQTQTY